jgi:hypothetical protein
MLGKQLEEAPCVEDEGCDDCPAEQVIQEVAVHARFPHAAIVKKVAM